MYLADMSFVLINMRAKKNAKPMSIFNIYFLIKSKQHNYSTSFDECKV